LQTLYIKTARIVIRIVIFLRCYVISIENGGNNFANVKILFFCYIRLLYGYIFCLIVKNLNI